MSDYFVCEGVGGGGAPGSVEVFVLNLGEVPTMRLSSLGLSITF